MKVGDSVRHKFYPKSFPDGAITRIGEGAQKGFVFVVWDEAPDHLPKNGLWHPARFIKKQTSMFEQSEEILSQ